jgi:phosphoglycerate kinase
MAKKTLEDCPTETFANEVVVVRVDYNLPLDPDGQVVDDTRLVRTLPTIKHLVDAGAKAVLLSHLGRPKGQPNPALSLRPVAEKLKEVLASPVGFCPQTIGPLASEAVREMKSGDVLLLENTRFCPEDTGNDPEWARRISYGTKLFVNDAFGAAHRAHASTQGIADVVRRSGGEAVAGFLLDKELRFLGGAMADPERPFVAIIGGAKISSKIDVIEALLPAVDRLLIGGAMANTFFKAQGWAVGDSLLEEDRVGTARSLMDLAGDKLLLPVDVVTGPNIAPDAVTRVAACDEVREGEHIGDIGPRSVASFAETLGRARTVIWSGPMGVFELAPFQAGTFEVARAAAAAADQGATVIVGGGDSAAAAVAAGVVDRITHIATGGSASLELLSGNKLPGVEALSDR